MSSPRGLQKNTAYFKDNTASIRCAKVWKGLQEDGKVHLDSPLLVQEISQKDRKCLCANVLNAAL
jgi:hypothetical protein